MVERPGLDDLLEAIDEPTLIACNGRIEHSNRAARAVLGQALANGDLAQAIPDKDSLRKVAAAIRADSEVTGIGSDERPWLLSVRPLGGERALVRLIDRSEARAAEKMRVDFVANASHELRTPLATLVGYSETLREQGAEIDSETRQRFVGIIHDEARRMQRLVEDLISLSRIEGERFRPPSDSVDVAALARQAAAQWQGYAEQRGSSIRIAAGPELPAITADRDQLLQVLDNLISNALRYGRPGTPVDVSVAVDQRAVRLTVADQGEGIAAKHIPRVTERFYRVDKARSRDSGGTGLGLAIVKHIVERHRGALEIRSKLGRGTSVQVSLPAGEAAVTKL